MQLPTNKWGDILASQLSLPYYQALHQFIISEYDEEIIYPPQHNLFTALELTDFDEVKVVILGQDPYHGEHQAHGLSFSMPQGTSLPPSLKNIFKELETDLEVSLAHKCGDLSGWAKQGVLLLNTVLTVKKGQAFSHKQKGWETFTDFIISQLNSREEPIIFVLWGKPAQQKKRLLSPHHIIIEAVHPSPLSAYRGFFGNRPFSSINEHLIKLGQKPINWLELQDNTN